MITPEEVAAALGELRARRLLQEDAYRFGFDDGYAAGWAAAEADMAEHWARLARRVRQNANRLKRPVIAADRAEAA